MTLGDRLYKQAFGVSTERRMKLEGSYVFKAPRERVWEALLNPAVLAQCIPGCQGLKEIAPDRYEARMKAGVAGLKDNYKGKISIKDKKPFSHYVMQGEGSGTPGFMRGDLVVVLEEKGGHTVVKYSTDAKVGGVLGGLGHKTIGGVAKMMAEQFFDKVKQFL